MLTENRMLTFKWKEACVLVGINLADHIVAGIGEYTGFMDRREIQNGR
jgi:DNA repair protein RadC